MGSILLACSHNFGQGIRTELLAGCVGDGAASEFFGWLDRMDLPAPELVLEEPKKYYKKPKQDQEHRTHAILGAAIAIAQATPSAEMWTKAWLLLAHAGQWNADVAISFAPILVDMDMEAGGDWSTPKEAHPFLRRMGKSMEM
jgi:hypothetical protein